MSYILVGLGNPGEEYEQTRHNLGRIMLDYFKEKNGFSDWENSQRDKGLISKGVIGKSKIILLKPETFMNKSGLSVRAFVGNSQSAEKLIVVHDDLDLPIGAFRISYNRGTGGHRGLDSIVKNIKTKAFIRIRVGISQTTPTGRLKKPQGEEKTVSYLMSDFNKKDLDILKKLKPKLTEVIEVVINEGRQKAMNLFN